MKKPHYRIERQCLGDGFAHVAGIDEVGRACLAGPVVAAAVVLQPGSITGKRGAWYSGVRDSKVLSPEQRFALEPVIKQHSVAWGIGVVPPEEIDRLNIHHASLAAMGQAVLDLKKSLESFDPHGTAGSLQLLIDGRFPVPGLSPDPLIKQKALIDGDAFVLSISAASILAKTYRDRLMVKLHQKFPGYGLAQNKGYPTRVHRQAIKARGLTAIHRLSFYRLSFCGNVI